MTATLNAISANLTLMEHRLHSALALTSQAREAALRGEQNLAIGTLLPAEQDITDAAVLVKTVLVLHRSGMESSKL